MRDLFVTNSFLNDLKREYASRSSNEKNKALKKELSLVVGRLLFDVALEQHHKDHRLTGNWVGYRDCHVYNDLVLIYRRFEKQDQNRKYGDNALVLTRLGSHSQLDW